MSRVKKVLIIAPSIKAESKEVAEDIEKYLVKYQSKYLECENSMDNPIFTDRQYYLLMVYLIRYLLVHNKILCL